MKKGFLLVVLLLVTTFVTACGGGLSNRSSRTVEDLLDGYIKAYTKADVDTAKEIFPPFYVEYAKDRLTKETLEKSLETAKKRFGDDFNIVYNITKEVKMTDEELDELNEDMEYYYKATTKASECYTYEGTITFRGSEYEDEDSLSTMAYCNYDGAWYLVDK